MKFCLSYDRSECSRGATELLQLLCKKDQDEAVVYHAFREMHEEWRVDPDSRGTHEELCKAAVMQLKRSCGSKDVSLVLRDTDDINSDLTDFCDGNVDILVIGNRGRGFLGRTIAGSVSTHALNHVKGLAVAIARAPYQCGHCPGIPAEASSSSAPETAPGAAAGPDSPQKKAPEGSGCGHGAGMDDPRQFLVFVDGSDPSQRAADLCAKWLRPGDTVKVVVLFENPSPVSGSESWAEGFSPVAASMSGSAQADVQGQRAALAAQSEATAKAAVLQMQSSRAGVDITAVVLGVDDIQGGIVEYAHNEAKAHPPVCGHIPRTILLMGSRGLGTLARLMLGSRTNYVMHHCELPLVVVH